MDYQSDLHFLQERIRELGSALLFNEHSAILKISTTLIRGIQMDAQGTIWFLVPRPVQSLEEFDREFPVRIEFFRKGQRFFLRVRGMARIEEDPVVTGNLIMQRVLEAEVPAGMILIGVRMSRADYYESREARRMSWWKEVRERISSWLLKDRPAWRPYDFQEGRLQL